MRTFVCLCFLVLTACGRGANSSGAAGAGGDASVGYSVRVDVSGDGHVTSNPEGIDCGTTCSMATSPGSRVTLTGEPAAAWHFDHWAGDCNGSHNNCSLSVTANATVHAVFATDSRPTGYGIAEIPPVEGVYAVRPAAINNLGDVVGSYETVYQGPARAFLYDASSGTVRRIMNDGTYQQFATGINDRRQVSGIASSSGFSRHGMRWENDKETDVGALSSTAEGSFTEANAINAQGWIAGSSMADDSNLKIILWDGTLHNYGPLAHETAWAAAINGKGVMVGTMGGPKPIAIENGTIHELGALGADGALAFGINDAGRIVGRSSVDPIRTHAFIYDLPSGPMRDVSPHGTYCQLVGINQAGVAVGDCEGSGIMLRGSVVEFLVDVVGDPNWEFGPASAINDRGQIVGIGSHSGQSRAYMISPR